METTHLYLLLWLFLTPSSSSSPPPPSLSPSCPLDLSYTKTIPWDYTPCLPSASSSELCCQSLLSLFGVALSLRLQSASLFRLPDAATSAACLAALQAALPPSLPAGLVGSCYPDPTRFVASGDSCAGIRSLADWSRRLPNDSRIDRACSGPLPDPACQECVSAGTAVASDLARIDAHANASVNCFYLTVIYAGAVNLAGPTDPVTAACVYGMGLLTPRSPSFRRIYAATAASAAVSAATLAAASGLYLWWRRKRAIRGREAPGWATGGGPRPNAGPIWLSEKDVRRATGGFAAGNVVGSGASGKVYRGVLPDGTTVAVKRLSGAEAEDEAAFRNEVAVVGSVRHRNLVPLRGCCVAGGGRRYLIYDYMPNGSLHERLFGAAAGRPPLGWPQRRTAVIDVARGLAYLHHGVRPSILHRDVKAANVLLDGDMRARVADFGLVRQGREGAVAMSGIAGTRGYLAPESALYGQITPKSDVYSFGVLVLEVMSGRKAVDMLDPEGDTAPLADWAWQLVKSGRANEVVDASLAKVGTNPPAVMERFVLVGILCAHLMVALRPTMTDALRMLEGDLEMPPIPDRPQLLYDDGGGYADRHAFSVSPAWKGSKVANARQSQGR